MIDEEFLTDKERFQDYEDRDGCLIWIAAIFLLLTTAAGIALITLIIRAL